jgi:WD40 repeat protein
MCLSKQPFVSTTGDEGVLIGRMPAVLTSAISCALGRPAGVPTFSITEVAFSPDGRTLATLTTDLFGQGQIQLWDVASREQLGKPIGARKEISGFAFSHDGRTLAARR